ncbi:pirin family protein [Burkholderiaceae bacterium DAT-1]|nr:pirin family protein [Burkholderiaceae bacterium DAT-1]
MTHFQRIQPPRNDLGEGMMVIRALPTRHQRTVGAWCFLDHIGPVDFPADRGMHVGAHPHIGLQTFTWLIEGTIHHRDSLGNDMIIRPGEVNLMTAGHGISHTEDSPEHGQRLHAAQLWIALPADQHDCPPAFEHHAALPAWSEYGARFTLLAGKFGDRQSPAGVRSPLIGLDIVADSNASLTLPLNPAFEYGLLPLVGEVEVASQRLDQDEFAYIPAGQASLSLTLPAGHRALLLGGEPLQDELIMWWNFVGFSKDTIRSAQTEWEQGSARFGQIGDDSARRLVAPPLPW